MVQELTLQTGERIIIATDPVRDVVDVSIISQRALPMRLTMTPTEAWKFSDSMREAAVTLDQSELAL